MTSDQSATRSPATAADWLDSDVPSALPLLILQSTVLFPLRVVSAQIAKSKNLRLLDAQPSPAAVLAAGVLLDPHGSFARSNLSSTAVACKILSRIKMAHDTTLVVLQGLRRVHIKRITRSRPYLQAQISYLDESGHDRRAVRERVIQAVELLGRLIDVDDRYPEELIKVAQLNVQNGSRCADLVADMVQFGYAQKRQLLEIADVPARLDLLIELLQREVARAQVAGEVHAATERSLRRSEREIFLREQLEVIRRELDELDPAEAEIAALAAEVTAAELPAAASENARREVERLRDGAVRAREGSSIRGYVEWVVSLPWNEVSQDRLDMRRARRMLNERYFGLGTAKERLLEFLAVRKLAGSSRLPLLAIIGPPGTGRSSLARTVADVLDRRLVEISLRGMRDEVELRGRRHTSVGARPGRILDGLRQAGTRNPVIVIDKIEQLEAETDATLALLEALDPTRNARFDDRYLGLPFDLSQTLFIIIVNVEEDIPAVLRDLAYKVELSGYAQDVKLEIAHNRIWPGLLEEYGLADRHVRLTAAALRRIIRRYTREAGVRELETRLRTICRRITAKVTTGNNRRLSIGVSNLEDYLGKPVFDDERRTREPQIGAAIALAWTEEGGDLLPIEALSMPGSGFISLTGLLGEVLEESVETALSYVRSRADELGIAGDVFYERDLHVHFPEGGIPKDGPSAGIGIATAIASLLSGRPVRHDVAMTGEISLQGRVLPVGAVREKLLAAYREGIRHVILPKGNENDLSEVPAEVRAATQIHLVEEVAEVFRLALRKKR